jgi:hypothetical protein
VGFKHHYLPKFYLKRWAIYGARLCEFSRPRENKLMSQMVYPDETGFVRGLYEMRGMPGRLREQFELLFLSPVDSQAADALSVLEKSGRDILTDRLRISWTRFLLTLMLRMPEDVADLKALADSFLRDDPETEARYQELRTDNDPEAFSEWLEKRHPHYVENAAFRLGKVLMDHDRIGTDILNLHWYTVDADATKFELLTSDRPLTMSSHMAISDAFIILPIGPRRLFLASRTRVPPDAGTIESLVTASNRAVVERAVRYAYATSASPRRYVEARMGKTPEDRILARLLRRNQRSGTEKITFELGRDS